jgi:chemotaxis protein CheD
MVRMGEYAIAKKEDDVLVTIGLGSCIGLALLDKRQRVAGLAHIMLPDSNAVAANAPGKFADTAVPKLVEELVKLGASPTRLEAILVGGASMFSFGDSQLDVGGRNERATRDALSRSRIPVRGTATGGSKGRTIRVYLNGPRVTSKEAGGGEQDLLGAVALAA